MAEVFGVVAGAVGVLEAGGRVSKKLHEARKRWKNAEVELAAFQEEVKALRFIVDSAYYVCVTAPVLMSGSEGQNGGGQRAELKSRLKPLIDEALKVLQLLETFITDLDDVGGRQKKKIWVMKKSEVEVKKAELGSIRVQISEVLQSCNAQVVNHTYKMLVGISLTTTETNRTVEALQNQVIKLQGQNNSTPVTEKPVTATTTGRIFDCDEPLTDLESHLCPAAPSSSSQSPGSSTGPHDKRLRLPTTVLESDQASTTTTTPLSAWPIPCSIEATCDGLCRCRCHLRGGERPSSWWKIRLLQGLLGAVRGSSYMPPPPPSMCEDEILCDVDTCRRRTTQAYNYEYGFPRWLLQRSIKVFWRRRLLEQSPTITLRFTVRVPIFNSNILGAAIYRDLEGIRACLAENPECVHFKDMGGGTALNLAVGGGRAADLAPIMQLLLRAGADPYCEDDRGITPATIIAYRYILGSNNNKPVGGTYMPGIEAMLPMTQIIDEMDLSPVTKIIMGLQVGDVASALRNLSTGGIIERLFMALDELDGMGRAPIHWAAAIGNHYALACLISSRANVNARDYDGCTALMFAAMSANALECVQLLLESGANIHARDRIFGSPAFHYACMKSDNKQVLELLIRQYRTATNTDALLLEDDNGQAGLHCAARYDNVDGIETLLEAGADKEVVDEEGRTPLITAAKENACWAYSFLIREGANRAHLDNNGQSVLHYAAVYATVEMMSVLAYFGGLLGVDIDAENIYGWTADHFFAVRKGKTPTLETAFSSLINVVRNGNERWLEELEEDDSGPGDTEDDDDVSSSSEASGRNENGTEPELDGPGCTSLGQIRNSAVEVGEDDDTDSSDDESIYADAVGRIESTATN